MSVRNSTYKNESDTMIKKLYQTQMDISALTFEKNMSTAVLQEKILRMKNAYTQATEMLAQTQLVLQYSLTADASAAATINALIATIDRLESAAATYYAAFIQFSSQIDKQIAKVYGATGDTTVLDQQLNLAKKAIEIQNENAETAYKNALIQQKDILFKAELGVKQAQETLDTLKVGKENQLGLAQNMIKTAKI